MEDALKINVHDLIRGLKHLTKDPSALLSPNHCAAILNGLFSQKLNEESIKCLLEDINTEVTGHKLNSVDDYVLNSSALHMLINKQLRNHKLEVIFKDLFNLIQKDGVIHKEGLKHFFQLCNISMPEESLFCICQIHLKMENIVNTIDYPTFIKLMEIYLKKRNS